MSVGTRIPQQVDGFATLRELLDLAKNPQAIIEASETARREMALTEEEKKKVDAARDFIAKHAQLSTELDNAKAALESDKKVFSAMADRVKSELAEREKSLVGLSDSLNEKSSMLDTKDKAHADERARLDAAQSALYKNIKSSTDKINEDSAKNNSLRDFLDKEKIRLTDFEANLKAKAAKLRESASEF